MFDWSLGNKEQNILWNFLNILLNEGLGKIMGQIDLKVIVRYMIKKAATGYMQLLARESLPFATAFGLTFIHLTFLQKTSSNNPLGISSNCDKIPFHPYFSSKDILGFKAMLLCLISLAMFSPNLLGDPENFTPENPQVTPLHIKPE
ncbi:hypothetical protein WISP_117113 [Willisornis vidua]|uniref:Cytochrome b n=1 Tax=Willisornis vidua TaxID=1566151 RepID=A0ABQ9CWP0_9PASS|nr:hypothetical protein WISP_117113 [Willisornis vidua]